MHFCSSVNVTWDLKSRIQDKSRCCAYIYLDIDCASISDGCHVMLGNALAKWIACCPVPEDISRATRALSDVTLLCNTARIGSLFLSAAAAFSILHIRRQVPGNKSNTWRAITATGRTNQYATSPLKAAKYGDPRHFLNCANAQNKCMHFDDGSSRQVTWDADAPSFRNSVAFQGMQTF